MSRLVTLCGAAALLVLSAAVSTVDAAPHGRTLVVTMTNDATSNQVLVYDADTNALIQTLSAHGEGGVAGNARGVAQYDGELFAAVNNGSGTVALFRRAGHGLKFDRLVTTTSAPVSIAFGNDHMYVGGTTTVDSFVLHHDNVGWMDGTGLLEVAAGGVPSAGSTAQVGVLNRTQLIVTLKTDPDPGTVDLIPLDQHGAVSGAATVAVSAPAGTLTPFGFVVYPDGTAVITLAHSGQNGLFRDGAFTSVVPAGQAAPCWATRVGKYVFVANTGSQTISRVVGTGSNVFVDGLVAASVPTGSPSDIDARAGVLGVIDHGAGDSHLTLFTYNGFGELTASGSAIALGALGANGVAVMPADRDRH